MNKTSKFPLLEIGLFRIALGIYLLFYSLPFLPKLSLYYGTQGMLPCLLFTEILDGSSGIFSHFPQYGFTAYLSGC